MKDFVRYLRDLQGRCVQVERGGPEACQGWLMDVKADYLALTGEEGSTLYLPLHHVRSITPLPAPALPPVPGAAQPAPENFAELLRANLGAPVRLYHAGPEVSFGILKTCAADHLLLESDSGEIACFTLFHIRSLLFHPQELDPWTPQATRPSQGG